MPEVHCRAEIHCLSVLSCWMMHSCCLEWTLWPSGVLALLTTHAGSRVSELETEIPFPSRVRQMSGSSVSYGGWPWVSGPDPGGGGGHAGSAAMERFLQSHLLDSNKIKLFMSSRESWVDHHHYIPPYSMYRASALLVSALSVTKPTKTPLICDRKTPQDIIKISSYIFYLMTAKQPPDLPLPLLLY